MNAVSEDVEKLVEKELEAANERFPQFHSPHEGWAVIREEVEELRQETDDVEEALNILWGRVRYNMRANPYFAQRLKSVLLLRLARQFRWRRWHRSTLICWSG